MHSKEKLLRTNRVFYETKTSKEVILKRKESETLNLKQNLKTKSHANEICIKNKEIPELYNKEKKKYYNKLNIIDDTE